MRACKERGFQSPIFTFSSKYWKHIVGSKNIYLMSDINYKTLSDTFFIKHSSLDILNRKRYIMKIVEISEKMTKMAIWTWSTWSGQKWGMADWNLVRDGECAFEYRPTYLLINLIIKSKSKQISHLHDEQKMMWEVPKILLKIWNCPPEKYLNFKKNKK